MQLKPPTDGNCKGMPVDWFFPNPKQTRLNKENKQAIAACRSCPVQKQCLEYALRYEHFGIWGGMTEAERRVQRSRMKISAQRPGGPLNRHWINMP